MLSLIAVFPLVFVVAACLHMSTAEWKVDAPTSVGQMCKFVLLMFMQIRESPSRGEGEAEERQKNEEEENK